ncbi:MAG: hypothetical protein Kow00109_08070 [Acidobacteriota bacterium]
MSVARWWQPGLICLALAGNAAGQRAELETILRSRGFTVLVDVVVTDEANRILPDLGAEDFRLYEDGVLQELDSVQYLSADEQPHLPPGPDRRTPTPSMLVPAGETVELTSLPSPATSRYAVVLLDLSSMDLDSRIRLVNALQHWFQKDLPPHTQVAVLALTPSLRLLAPFTDQPRELVRTVERLKRQQTDFAAADASLLRPLVMEPFLTGAAEDPSGYQGNRILDSLEIAQPELLKNPFTLRIIRAFLTMRNYVEARHAETIFDAIEGVVEGLGTLPGRKLLLLASEGFAVGGISDRKLYASTAAAARSGVAIYVVQPQGLETHGVSGSLGQRGQLSELNAESAVIRKDAVGGDTLFDRAKTAGSDLPTATLRHLAEATGGSVVQNTNDLVSGLREIARKAMSYYLLAYRSSRPEYDGTIRRLKVEVTRPRARVFHRTSYRAVPPGLEALTTEQYRLWRSVELEEVPLTLPARASVFVFPAVTLDPNLALIVEIPVDALELRPAADSPESIAQLTLDSFLREPVSGEVVSTRRIPLNLHLTQAEKERLPFITLGVAHERLRSTPQDDENKGVEELGV